MVLGRRERITLFVGLPVLFVALLYKLVFAPSLDRLHQLDATVYDMQEELRKAEKLGAQEARLDNDIQNLKKSIEARPSSFDLFGLIIEAASKAGIRDRCDANPNPSRTRSQLDYRPEAVSVTLAGVSLKELTNFLYQIHAADKLLIIDPIEISVPGSRSNAGLNVTMTVSTLVRS